MSLTAFIKNSSVESKEILGEEIPTRFKLNGEVIVECDSDGRTPLWWASRKLLKSSVQLLLAHGAAEVANKIDQTGCSPLRAACMVDGQERKRDQDVKEIVEILLSSGADPNIQDKDGRTPLYSASFNGHSLVVEALIQSGADVARAAKKDGWTCLHAASRNGYAEVVSLLLKAGADTNATKKDGWTALHAASKHGHIQVVDMLLTEGVNKGAKVDATDKDGKRPLHSACAGGHVAVIVRLLRAEANIAATDMDGLSALHFASENGHTEAVTLLLTAGADIKSAAKNGDTPLHRACREGHSDTIQVLLDAGADLDAPNKAGLLPMALNSKGWADPSNQILASMLISDRIEAMIHKSFSVVVYNGVKSKIIELLGLALRKQSRHILRMVLNVRLALQIAMKNISAEEEELNAELEKIDAVLIAILQLPKLDDSRKLTKLLIAENVVETSDERSINVVSLNDDVFIGLCLSHSVKIPLGFSPVIRRVLNVFFSTQTLQAAAFHCGSFANYSGFWRIYVYGWTRVDDPRSRWVDNRSYYGLVETLYDYGLIVDLSGYPCILDDLCQLGWNPRTCPALMFFLEGCSKLTVLILVGHISVQEYGHDGQLGFHGTSAQIALLVMLGSGIVYEIGQMRDEDESSLARKVFTHIQDPWNRLDAVTYLFILIWAVLLWNPSRTVACQISLSLSAIPLAFSLFQYLSVSKSLGRLVIMVLGMIYDILNFVWLYLIALVGFGTTLWGLFNHTGITGYGGPGFAFMELFSSSFGGVNYAPLIGYPDLSSGNYSSEYTQQLSDHAITNTGIVVYIVFIVMQCTLLMNLLIARMTCTHNRIDASSTAEWGFMMASITKNHLVVREQCPLRMLPPPLNIVPTVLSPLHYLLLHSYGISLGGTVCNVILRLMFAWPRAVAWSMMPAWALVVTGVPWHLRTKVFVAMLTAWALSPISFAFNIGLACWPFSSESFVRVELEEEQQQQLEGAESDVSARRQGRRYKICSLEPNTTGTQVAEDEDKEEARVSRKGVQQSSSKDYAEKSVYLELVSVRLSDEHDGPVPLLPYNPSGSLQAVDTPEARADAVQATIKTALHGVEWPADRDCEFWTQADTVGLFDRILPPEPLSVKLDRLLEIQQQQQQQQSQSQSQRAPIEWGDSHMIVRHTAASTSGGGDSSSISDGTRKEELQQATSESSPSERDHAKLLQQMEDLKGENSALSQENMELARKLEATTAELRLILDTQQVAHATAQADTSLVATNPELRQKIDAQAVQSAEILALLRNK